MKTSKLNRVVMSIVLLAFMTVFEASCKKPSDPGNPPSNPSSPKTQTPFERDLDYVRTGQFIHMFVFSKKDGGVFTSDDITYLKANSPAETNQWVKADGGQRVIAGTNFEFKQEHFDALNKRFNIEDLSGK